MNSVLTWVAGVLAVVLAAMFAVPYFVDWNGYRGVFEEEASRILGRNVRVRGDVNLRLLPSPYVRFEQLKVSDSTGLTGEPLFFAESFTMWLALPPMLKGIIEAERIELEKPVVRLVATSDGRGNWNGLSIQAGSLPFVPAGIALQSVHIVDGTVSIDVEGTGRLGEVRQIEGELVATELAGPYSFLGTARLGRSKYNVNAALSERDKRGDMRVKIRTNVPRTPDVYTFVGNLSGIDGQPKITGDFKSSLVLGAERMKSGTEVEILAAVSADNAGAQAKNVTIRFESSGQPQTISGDARANWGTQTRSVVSLSSQWLDLDQFNPQKRGASKPDASAANTKQDASSQSERVIPPLETLRMLLGGLDGYMPAEGSAEVRLNVDQANLGGDSVSDIRLVLKGIDGALEIESLRARLPGSGRLEFAGKIDRSEDGVGFAGNLFVGGPSFARVKRWAVDQGETVGVINDGPFSVDGRLVLGPKMIAIKKARAEFSGVPVTGGVQWSGDERGGKVSVDLEGHELDSRWVGIKDVDLKDLVRGASGGAADLHRVLFGVGAHEASDASAEPGGVPEVNALGSASQLKKVSVKLKAGKLINGGAVLRNVDADVSVVGGKLSIGELSFETSEGLEVELEGGVTNLEKVPNGELRFVASARDARAVGGLAPLIEVGTSGATGALELLKNTVPFRLAGKINLGERAAGVADVSIDGVVRDGRLYGQMLFDGGLNSWRERQADVTMTVESDTSRAALGLLGMAKGPGASGTHDDAPMRAVFKAVGVPANNMRAMGLAQSDRITLVYNGSVGVDQDKNVPVRFNDGEFVVAAADSRDVLELIGIPVSPGVVGVRVDGFADFVREDDKVTFHPRDMKVGESTFAGRIAFLSGEEGAAIIDADLVVDKVALTSMLSLALGPATSREGGPGPAPSAAIDDETAAVPEPKRVRRQDRAKVESQSEEQASELPAGVRRIAHVFSDSPFDLSGLKDLHGRVGLTVGRFDVGDGLAVTNAELENILGEDEIDVSFKSGSALGGVLSGTFAFEKGRAGVSLTGGFKLANASLEKLAAWDETGSEIPFASGDATIKAAFNGRALSPRGLLAVLSGKGEIALTKAKVKGLSPEIVSKAADEIIAREVAGGSSRNRSQRAQQDGDGQTSVEVADSIKERLNVGELDLGTRTIPIDIVDGAARLTPFSMKNAHGVTRAKITFDIGQLAVDGDFRLSTRPKDDQAAWPEVAVVFVGPAGRIGALDPLISAAALEREVLVRKMERNVQELERLRKLDEDAVRRRREREEERQRELEAARALAAEEAEANDPDIVAPDDSGIPGAVGPEGQPIDPDAAWDPAVAGQADGDPDSPQARAEAERLKAEQALQARRRANAKARLKRKSGAASQSANDIFLQQF